MKKIIYINIAVALFFCVNYDAKSQNVLDGVFTPEHTTNRQVIPYAHLREADVMWLKRIWREVDLRQKLNHTMFYPEKPMQGRKNLFDVIKDAITKDGTLTAYSTGALGDDDMFTQELTLAEVNDLLSEEIVQYAEDPNTGEMIETKINKDVSAADVKKYQIKEEWFFDRQRSVMDVRIIGICPLVDEYNEYGEFKGSKKLFWIYFPEARYVFKNAEVYNRFNDTERRTYEDIFWKRQFSSYIIKESNVYDRSIAEHKVGLDALLEAEKIEEKIFNMEHDLWEF